MTHKFLSIKTNALRRLPTGYYKLNSTVTKNALCVGCVRERCEKLSEASKEDKTVVSCDSHIPVLRFVSTRNLDKEIVNTIRLGSSWKKRLSAGDTVGCYCAENDKLYKATVVSIHWDEDKDRFFAEHARFNHLGMECEDPDSEMPKIIRNSSGAGFYAKANGLTAIYLENFQEIDINTYQPINLAC